MNFRRAQSLFLCLASILLLSGCAAWQPATAYAPWVYADLRGLDAAEAQLPGLDLLAIYIRSEGARLEMRLDFLEQAALPDYDLYLALDARPTGRHDLPGGQGNQRLNSQADLAWDTLLVIPASGEMQALDELLTPQPDLALRVVRDPTQDSVVISLNRQAMYGEWMRGGNGFPGMQVQVFVTEPGSPEVADSLGPVNPSGFTPPPARAMFVFWNSFPAYTPATALRRWNGAHTGPFGGSHGLVLLLRAAREAGIPLMLLDLRTPAALSALDYASGLGLALEMEREGLLALPEYIPDLPPVEDGGDKSLPDQVIETQRQVALDFGLRPTRLASTPGELFQSPDLAQVVFARVEENEAGQALTPVYLQRKGSQRVLPVMMASGSNPQTTSDGLSLEVKRALLEAALASRQGAPAPLVILGGDLPASAWGAGAEARAGFRYLHAHPWIQVMSAQELAQEQARAGVDGEISGAQALRPYTPNRTALAEEDNARLLAALDAAPQNSLGRAAWQAYLALFAPVFPADRARLELRAGYAGQAWSLLAAARWAEDPRPQADCTADLDHDGQPECILASERFYAQFDIESGTLTFLFEAGEEAHQLIGPSSQFITGLGTSADWDLNGGLSADPSVIPGAFAEPGLGYQASLQNDGLVFTSADHQIRKAFRLLPEGLAVEYRFASRPPFTAVQVPLALDPWRRFSPGWADRYNQGAGRDQITWQVEGGPQVAIQADGGLRLLSSLDARPFFSRPEDPNMDYPAGHFLPFPLLLVESRVPGEAQVFSILIHSLASGG